MKLSITTILLFVGSVAFADDAASKAILKQIEGTWKPTAVTQSGNEAAAEFLNVMTVIVKGDQMTVRFTSKDKNDDKVGTLVVDASKKPFAIDLTPNDGPRAGKPMLGIASFDKEELKLCWHDANENATRPKDFTSSKENKQFVVVLKKIK